MYFNQIAERVVLYKFLGKGEKIMTEESKCPVTGRTSRPISGGGMSNRDWWPNQLNLRILHQQDQKSNPMGKFFNYAKLIFYSC
jgi:catalase (peroxidase I)